jgi:hypothetical protein
MKVGTNQEFSKIGLPLQRSHFFNILSYRIKTRSHIQSHVQIQRGRCAEAQHNADHLLTTASTPRVGILVASGSMKPQQQTFVARAVGDSKQLATPGLSHLSAVVYMLFTGMATQGSTFLLRDQFVPDQYGDIALRAETAPAANSHTTACLARPARVIVAQHPIEHRCVLVSRAPGCPSAW